MSLNKRDIKMLNELRNKSFPINSLSEKYEVSERNIRYSIDNINFYLKKCGFDEIVIKKGNAEIVMSEGEFEDFIQELDIDMYSFSQEEREIYILSNYLFKENAKISQLEKDLNVSRTTIKKDITNLKEYLNKFELYFEREENKIFIKGKEKKLRHLKLLRMLENIEVRNGQIIYFYKKYFGDKKEQLLISEYLKNFDIKKLNDIVDEIEKELGANFTEEFKNIMIIYLTATLERINHGFVINKKNNSDFLRKLEEFKKIKNVLSKIINEHYEYEMLHLTEYFLSGYYNENFSENIFILERFISKMIEDIDIQFKSNLIKDKKLSDKLLKYLLPAIYRIKNNFFLDKELDFTKIDSIIYEKIKDIVHKNNSYLKEPLREEEIFYISKYVEEAFKYDKERKISLVELLNIIKENAKVDNIDIIADTIKMKFEDFINDDRDMETISKKLIDIIDEDSIYILKDYSTFGEALDIGLEILLNKDCITEKSIYNLKNMVEKFGRYMFIDDKILLCYDKEIGNCLKAGIIIIVSEKGIKVDDKEQANILFILSSKNKTEHLKAVGELNKIIENNEFLKEIVKLDNNKKIETMIKDFLK